MLPLDSGALARPVRLDSMTDAIRNHGKESIPLANSAIFLLLGILDPVNHEANEMG